MQFHWAFFPESQMSVPREDEARALLVAAFPQHAEFFEQNSYRGSTPEYRLFGRDDTGALVAHLECGPRVALVGDHQVRILGIGAVAVHPTRQGRGVGREMFAALQNSVVNLAIADYGFLECREAVAEFYRRAGFERIDQPCRSLHHETGESETYHGPVMVLPLRLPMIQWPRNGEVNLQGMSW